MADRTVNVLLTSFRGLGLPPTLTIPTSTATPIKDLRQQITDQLPTSNSRFILTTTSNKELTLGSQSPVKTLFSNDTDAFLTLRLTVPLCGGKGGFGSQLRAAGGRMSSKRKKNQGDTNSSNRNLDGRRLRTVNEAKALAEYLALKPNMEKKEREARRKRWEQVVEITERREEELRNGSKGKLDGQWVEDKEEAGERARAAALSALNSGEYRDNLGGSLNGNCGTESGSEEDEKEGLETSAGNQPITSRLVEAASRTYVGFDDDDEFMSGSEIDENPEEKVVGEGKGMIKA